MSYDKRFSSNWYFIYLILGSYPNLSDTKLDMSPVDFVAKSIIYMVLQKDSILKYKAK